eukprot:CAMPEP_0203666874 /NCGR_PEP_ID=MMETSP0090-20130426/3817_1 /ASSEMBLY_ACC=CAM_ASM_001088 /TAXON_ID=426623 /ORGANISM="Chaetoceros affinis, Strain CCMP159" /LENGTH=189 /DNA_ID=CAMNT_0050530869 /DNA_START=30 /DNA_END=600 /DNA_ORIENTATION=+
MKPSSSSKIYASLDQREIAQDRRIINEKLRRHLSSTHQNEAADYGDDFYHDANVGNAQLDRYMNEGEDDMIDSMQRALHNDIDSIGSSVDPLRRSLGVEQRSQINLISSNDTNFMRSGTVSSIPSTFHLSNIASSIPGASIDIPKTQSMRKQIYGVLYIFLSVGILVSYFFFLESCKLVIMAIDALKTT